jgi:hypothetical protein
LTRGRRSGLLRPARLHVRHAMKPRIQGVLTPWNPASMAFGPEPRRSSSPGSSDGSALPGAYRTAR